MRLRTNSGFTTLELLVTLSLMAFIALGIGQGLHVAQRTWSLGLEADRQGNIEAAALAISRLLEMSVHVSTRNSTQGTELMFDGGPQSVRFIYLSEGDGQRGGLILAHLGRDQATPQNLGLMTREYRAGEGWGGSQLLSRSQLLSGVTDLTISYFGADSPEASQQWQSDWIGKRYLPSLIRVKLTIGQNRQVTSWTIRLRQS